MNGIDGFDLIFALGALLVVMALYLGLGLAPALGFLGAVLVLVGTVGALGQARRSGR